MSHLLPPDLPHYLLTITLTLLLPTTSLILTPKTSPLRYIALALTTYLASRFITPTPGASVIRTTLCGQLILITAQTAHFLLIRRLDDRDIAREIPHRAFFRSDRLWYAAELFVQPRGVGTPREVKNVPAHPGYYASRRSGTGTKDGDGKDGDRKDGAITVSRGTFLTRQFTIFIWQYLVLDIMQAAARQQAFERAGGGVSGGFTHINWFISAEKWVERGLTNLITWFVMTRILIDSNYRLVSIIFVGLGWDGPEKWPPAFGRMRDVYTVRKFWGKFWHQFLRGPLTGISNFVTRDVLHLPRPSILERYTNMFVVFLLSGIMHALTDRVQNIPFEYSGALIGFPITLLAIMFEDGVQELWKRFNPSTTKKGSSDDDVPPLWQRAVGYVWTLTWLGVASTWYLYPIYELPGELTMLVPVSLTERVGMQPLAGIVLGAGLVVGYLFKVEI
ncbi:uncharacterized protein N7496_012214 [Penicillium cataractarum]|uniref:Wax synthase domain-containing protein n=1 Tax=Penicillium cataractarum TaxID=2100454 RepID=A0A9W9URT8_9EURO|nr:uncharacterized protein N7496_012214 [Penicillium cataractarum]KAJ5355002.1 hypothetical protein N7496_012214 [Penicillium cataractarum]